MARTNRAVLVEQSGLEHAETALERAEELVVGEQHLANEAGGEAAPAARQLVAGQLRARHAVPERELLHALAKIGRVAAAGCARERGDMQLPSLLTSHPESGLTPFL